MIYPDFISHTQFLDLHDGLTELELLSQFSANIKQIHKLTTAHYKDFDLLISDYLMSGLKIFDLDIGIVSKVEGNNYIVCDAITPDNSLKSGDIFEVEGTYCREVIKTQSVIGFPHVGSIDEMKGHPVYQNMKLESYISAPIFKDEKLFGTLNFSSTKIRKFGFSFYEKDLIEMMANAIGNFLLLRDKEEKLEASNKRMRELTAFVAHDLRAPLGNIMTLSELIPELDKEEQLEPLKLINETSEKSLEIVHSILQSAMIGKGKIGLDKSLHNFKDIIVLAINELVELKGISLHRFQLDLIDIEILLDKERISQVVLNLLSNSLKYSPAESKIEIKTIVKDHKMNVLFSNEIDRKEYPQNILDVSTNSSLGFGLQIIEEVLELHDVALKIYEKKNKFFVEFDFKV